MQQFILARGQKPNAFVGIKRVPREGTLSDIVHKIEFMFRPGRVVNIPDDVDMSSWVDGGQVVPVKPGKSIAKEPLPDKTVTDIEIKPKAPAIVSVSTNPVPRPADPPKAPIAPPKVEPPKEEPPVVEPLKKAAPEKEPKLYEELKDGTLQCSQCDKAYKPSSRAEEYIMKHIKKEH